MKLEMDVFLRVSAIEIALPVTIKGVCVHRLSWTILIMYVCKFVSRSGSSSTRVIVRDGQLEKLLGGVGAGNFRAAGIFFL